MQTFGVVARVNFAVKRAKTTPISRQLWLEGRTHLIGQTRNETSRCLEKVKSNAAHSVANTHTQAEAVEICMSSKHVIRILLVMILINYDYFVLQTKLLYWRCYIYIY